MKKSVRRVAGVVGIILLIPIGGNLFVEGWNWGVLDFVVMGALLFVTGLALDFVLRKVQNPVYRVLGCFLIVLALLAVWAELAVDAVSRFLGGL